MLELVILSIFVVIIFIAAIWYSGYRSKQRSKQFALGNENLEPIPEHPEHQFGTLFHQQMTETRGVIETGAEMGKSSNS